MALGLYKPGQGYWVRVVTAALMGTATLMTAAWMWEQGARLADSLPRDRWVLGLERVEGTVAPGDEVSLLRAGQPTPIASARVTGVESVGARTELSLDSVTGTEPPNAAKEVTASGGAFRGTVATALGRSFLEPVYVQGGLAVTVILIGAVLTYWLVGVRAQSVEFLIATDFEMRKVNWSTRKEVLGSTWVVIGATVLISATLFFFDYVFQFVFRTIDVLK